MGERPQLGFEGSGGMPSPCVMKDLLHLLHLFHLCLCLPHFIPNVSFHVPTLRFPSSLAFCLFIFSSLSLTFPLSILFHRLTSSHLMSVQISLQLAFLHLHKASSIVFFCLHLFACIMYSTFIYLHLSTTLLHSKSANVQSLFEQTHPKQGVRSTSAGPHVLLV